MQYHIAKNIDELSITVANAMVEYIQTILQKQDRFSLVLSGGSTPKKLHQVLSSAAYINKIDWTKVHIFFGDERFVPFADDRNNAKMAFDTLLNLVAVNPSNIHIMPTENISPEESANAYEQILHTYFNTSGLSHGSSLTENNSGNSFDLVLLGMGDDGHTLSLFPGQHEIIFETAKWCKALWLQSQNMFRITLTHALVNKAATIFFLVSGKGKAIVLNQVINGIYKPEVYPSQIIQPNNGELHWFLDREAAANLPSL